MVNASRVLDHIKNSYCSCNNATAIGQSEVIPIDPLRVPNRTMSPARGWLSTRLGATSIPRKGNMVPRLTTSASALTTIKPTSSELKPPALR